MSETVETRPASLDLIVQEFCPGTLATNAHAIMEFVQTKLEGYKAENYSEDNIGKAKQDKAELNSAAKQLNDKRLEYERKFMEPFSEFKDLVTQTCALIKTASGQIDVVVKEVEEREKADKKAKIEAFFAGQGCELFTLDRIFQAAWLNKTVKLKDVQAEITAGIAKANQDLLVLDKIGEPDAKAHYLITLDLQSAMAKADEIMKNRERLAAIEKARVEEEARKKAEAEERIARDKAAAEERARIEAEKKPATHSVVVDTPVPIEIPEPVVAPISEPVLECTLRFKGTKAQLVALKDYMTASGIEYEKL